MSAWLRWSCNQPGAGDWWGAWGQHCHLSSGANVTFMEHFNSRTMFRNFVSHLVNFYKDQGLIHQRFSRISRNAQNISSGFNTNFDVSVSQCSGGSGAVGSGPMMTDTTWPGPDHESVDCSLASPWTNVASDNSAQQINVQRFQIRHKYYSLGAAGAGLPAAGSCNSNDQLYSQ